LRINRSQEFQEIIEDDRLATVPLLVLANKQDLAPVISPNQVRFPYFVAAYAHPTKMMFFNDQFNFIFIM
jgi:signal recognition particle receptor subunit beta